MSREKEIEEMAEIMEHNGCSSHTRENCYGATMGADCTFYEDARALYDAGYRKQSEGEWKGNGYLQHCSVCGNVVNFNNVSRWLYNFCPNCGAKMKGESNG